MLLRENDLVYAVFARLARVAGLSLSSFLPNNLATTRSYEPPSNKESGKALVERRVRCFSPRRLCETSVSVFDKAAALPLFEAK